MRRLDETKANKYMGEKQFAAFLDTQSDDEFYITNPELKKFDNGEGWFVVAENRRVEMQEFTEAGRAMYDGVSDSEEARDFYRSFAAQELTKILKSKGDTFARWYISRALTPEVARFYLQNGGRQFYSNAFPKNISVSNFAVSFLCGNPSSKQCNSNSNKLDIDAQGKVKLDFVTQQRNCKSAQTTFNIDDAKPVLGEDFSNVYLAWTITQIATQLNESGKSDDAFALLVYGEYLDLIMYLDL